MSWRRCICLVLALLLLLSGSGAAMLCIEADGSARVELLASVCCEPVGVDGHGGSEPELCPAPPCAGCDDRPLEGASWTSGRHAGSVDVLALILAPVPSHALGPALLCAPRFERAGDQAGPPDPRSARPSSLRC